MYCPDEHRHLDEAENKKKLHVKESSFVSPLVWEITPVDPREKVTSLRMEIDLRTSGRENVKYNQTLIQDNAAFLRGNKQGKH